MFDSLHYMNRIINIHYFTECLLEKLILGQGTTGAQLRIFLFVMTYYVNKNILNSHH